MYSYLLDRNVRNQYYASHGTSIPYHARSLPRLFIHNTQYAVALYLTTTIYIAIYFFYNLAQRTMFALLRHAAILRSLGHKMAAASAVRTQTDRAASANLSSQRPVARYTTEHSLYPSSSP